MNELENQNLHEYIIRKSILVLLVKGGFAWIMLSLMDYGFDSLPRLLRGTDLAASINTQALSGGQPWFHLILNFLFGWLLLYVTLTWVFEYYIIKQDSIVIRNGIIFSDENVYQIEDVKTIEVTQGFFGKIFNVGSLHFYAFRADKHVYLSNISQPDVIAAHMHALHPAPQTVTFPSKKK